MPHEKREFENGEVYHVILRRVGNEILFGDVHDDYRGIFSIYEFNNSSPVRISERRKERARFKKTLQGLPLQDFYKGCPSVIAELLVEPDKRVKLVEVLAFCLMPNHIHLLLRQVQTNGISKFMLKLGSGYASYFKEKYQIKIKGHFFQERFQAVPILTDEQLQVVFIYIHTNPLALIEPGWKEKGIQRTKRAINFLEQKYRWSSYFDFLEKKNFPSIIEAEKNFLSEVMGGVSGCRQAVNDWILHKGDMFKLAQKFSKLGLSLE